MKIKLHLVALGYKEGCKFVIWKKIAGKTITKQNAIDLLTKGQTKKITGFKSKQGKTFSAKLILDNEGLIKFEF